MVIRTLSQFIGVLLVQTVKIQKNYVKTGSFQAASISMHNIRLIMKTLPQYETNLI